MKSSKFVYSIGLESFFNHPGCLYMGVGGQGGSFAASADYRRPFRGQPADLLLYPLVITGDLVFSVESSALYIGRVVGQPPLCNLQPVWRGGNNGSV